jgi:DNA-binding transcriptional regulator YhcF (GntR family)
MQEGYPSLASRVKSFVRKDYMGSVWSGSKGYYTVEREVEGQLTREIPSVRAVFHVLVSQAFTRPIPVFQNADRQGPVTMWEAGSRPWGQRGLAEAAGLSVPTIRRAIKRLQQLGLIHYVTSKLGTMIQVLRFWNYRRKNPNLESETVAIKESFTQRGITRGEKLFPYRSSTGDLYKPPRTVDVPRRRVLALTASGIPVWGR